MSVMNLRFELLLSGLMEERVLYRRRKNEQIKMLLFPYTPAGRGV
jgi:hypothetical protein